MNNDELSQLVINEYNNIIKNDSIVRNLMAKIRRGEATYEDAYKLSRQTGKALQQAISKQITEDILIDDKLTVEVANTLLSESLELNFNNLSGVCERIQASLNKKAKINLKPYKQMYNQEKTNGIIKYVSTKNYTDVESSFLQSIVTNSQGVIDDAVRGNVKLQYDCGLSPKIHRIGHFGMCKWCTDLVGTYNYDDVSDTGNDVFRRHANCGCMVLYDPRDGKVQDVHSKKWINNADVSKNIESDIKNIDWMGRKEKIVLPTRNKDLTVYKISNYSNIYTQTNTKNAQKISEYLNYELNINNNYENINKIVIARYNALEGISAYDHVNNVLYIAEELIDNKKFSKLINSTFPAKNIKDVLIHELGGHKAHWDSIYKYMERNNISDIRFAKIQLENDLRKYVIAQIYQNSFYIDKNISRNAFVSFNKTKNLNELIADGKVLLENNSLKDNHLGDLINKVINYDEKK